MPIALSLAGLACALVGVVANQLVTFFPRLGLAPLHRVRSVQAAAAVLALSLAGAGWLLGRSTPTLVLGCVTAFLAAASPFLLNPRMALIALRNPPRVSASGAGLPADATVIGAKEGGTALAWPLDLLIPHHVVNDRLGDQPVLAAWCDACRTAVVYAATSGGPSGPAEPPGAPGRALTFEVTGVYRGNLVMRDLETRSLWQHATGEALIGPLAGARLRPLDAERTSWAAWIGAHPETEVAVEPGKRGVLSNRAVTRLLHWVTSRITTPGLSPRDYRLPLRKEVIGLELDGAARAYPMGLVSSLGRLEDVVGERRVELCYDAALDRVTAFDLGAGERLPFFRGWWHAWYEFHPHTTVFR